MLRYNLPDGMRYSTLEERRRFFRHEFDLGMIENWFTHSLKNPVFAVVMGRQARIYPLGYEEDAFTTILIDEYHGLNEVKEWIL